MFQNLAVCLKLIKKEKKHIKILQYDRKVSESPFV